MPALTACVIDITRCTLDIEPERITGNARFTEDLGADSFDCVELMMAFEEAFDIEIADEELPGLTTVAAVTDYLRHRASDAPAVMSMTAA